MGFLRKILGIEDFEKKKNEEVEQLKKEFEQVKSNLKTSWNWINYLHELEQDNRSRIKKIDDQGLELKELIKSELSIKNRIKEAVPLQAAEIIKERVNEDTKKSKLVPEQKKEEPLMKEMDIKGIGKNEAYLLQILYRMACFDGSSSVETGKIFENLPYQITVRGLRKKLYKLQQQGIINSIMYGNTRRWYLDMEKLAKLKKFLTEKAV